MIPFSGFGGLAVSGAEYTFAGRRQMRKKNKIKKEMKEILALEKKPDKKLDKAQRTGRILLRSCILDIASSLAGFTVFCSSYGDPI